MKDKYKKFYMMFDKRFKNLILCSNLNSDGRVEGNGDLNMKKVYLLTAGLMFFSSLIYAYSSYVHSRDGSSVACGGEYSSYVHSRDGSSVCAGWVSN